MFTLMWCVMCLYGVYLCFVFSCLLLHNNNNNSICPPGTNKVIYHAEDQPESHKDLKKTNCKTRERVCLRGLFLSNVHQVFKSRNKYSYIDLLKKENILNRKPCKWDAQVDKNRTNAQKYLNIKHLIKSKAVLCLQSGFSLSLKAVVHLNWNVCSQIFHHLSWKH